MNKVGRISVAVLLAAVLSSGAAAREVEDISRGWTFTKEGVSVTVDIPHTWNAEDTFDAVKGYWRGACEYSRTIRSSSGRTFLRVGAANLKAEVFVGGRSVGTHAGGYTAFCFELTGFLEEGDNQIVIRVDNSFDKDIAPLSADFTFYGGISRKVELIRTGKDCISPVHFASGGVYITPAVCGDGDALAAVRTMVDASSGSALRIEHLVLSPDGKRVARVRRKVRPGSDSDSCSVRIPRPELWDVDNPSLYTLVTVLRDSRGRELDRVSTTFGIRSFRFDAGQGLILNGRHVKIMGAARHQDYENIGNALPDSLHVADAVLLKKMGGNFMRTAHYPQAPALMGACDSLGILASVEIPIVDHATISEEFTRNQLSQLREMIFQNFNSPSVLLWGYMNEAILQMSFRMKPAEEERLAYYAGLRRLAATLNAEAKRLDPSRATMVVFADDIRRYSETGIPEIPDVQGWNIYRGWYGRSMMEFGAALDEIHARFPEKPLIVTEYGAGIDPRLHSDAPERFDFSPEYGLEFHRRYASAILSRPFVAGGVIWALADFYSEARTDSTPHVNNKGITSLGRREKDVYMYYSALLRESPYLSIGGKDWTSRSGNARSVRNVPVFSNAPEVSLFLNGKPLGTRQTEDCTAVFPVVLEDGENVLRAVAGGLSDTLRVGYSAVDMDSFKSLRVMMGGSRYYSSGGVCWIPEQPYSAGSWGYIGGKPGRPTASGREIPCSNSDIQGTTDDPLYQSQRVGLEAFICDVPAGKYKVILHFAELSLADKTSVLAYNLGNDIDVREAVEREFDVFICGAEVLKGFNIRKEYGPLRAVSKEFEVETGGGLDVRFAARKGSTVLNSIEIIRNQ